MIIGLYIVTFLLAAVSLAVDRRKTMEGIKIALKRMKGILFPLLLILAVVSVLLYFIPANTISSLLSREGKYPGLIAASLLGSVTMMPGFIAFPLGGILKQNGVPYMVISAFTTTLMMVGVLTFPVERNYFGTKVALLRNCIGFCIALMVAFVTGIVFGEVLQ